jgi:hypothetical protein
MTTRELIFNTLSRAPLVREMQWCVDEQSRPVIQQETILKSTDPLFFIIDLSSEGLTRHLLRIYHVSYKYEKM